MRRSGMTDDSSDVAYSHKILKDLLTVPPPKTPSQTTQSLNATVDSNSLLLDSNLLLLRGLLVGVMWGWKGLGRRK
jgi:hypothetical protein